MSLVNIETGELIDAITYGEVKDSVATAKASLEAAAEQIVWQIENHAWIVLGYRDWNEMREAEYGGAAFMVPRAERPELVARLRRSGLTQQEIAETAGVGIATVNRDLAAHLPNGRSDEAPTIVNARGQQRPASYAPRPVPTIEEAVAEFPDLGYYAETGRAADVPQMANDLRRFRERGELPHRLDNLRRSIAVDQSKRDGTYQPTQPEASVCPTCGQTVRSPK